MKKLALIVGVNYPNTSNALIGCVNDAKGFTRLLTEDFGFFLADIQILLDDIATKKNILEGIDRLVKELEPGDSGVFVFSGHGTRTADLPPIDEDDMMDEAIVPSDSINNPENYIRDDEILERLSQLQPNVHFTIVFDSCHSGTGTKPLTSTKFKYIDPTPGTLLIKNFIEELAPTRTNPKRSFSGMNHYLLAGCKSDQQSRDALNPNENSYFTAELLKNIKPGITYEQLYNKVVPAVMESTNNSQEPQFEGPDLSNQIFGI